MKRKAMTGLAASLAIYFGAVHCVARTHNEIADPERFQTFNFFGQKFGLKGKELALTVDDGPGSRTLELAKWLRKENVPTTFFMVGKNAKYSQNILEEIVKLDKQGDPLFIIANHSMNHDLAMPDTDVVSEVKNADNYLDKHIKALSAPFLFRAPYGDFIRGYPPNSNDHARVEKLNATSLQKYIGPIFWDVGGDMANQYSADWACWSGGHSFERCLNGYVKESQDLCQDRGCVVLMHDIHSKTVDMITGTNVTGVNPSGRSFVKEMRSKGYSFVGLNKYPDKLSAYGTVPQREVGEVEFNIQYLDSMRLRFEVEVPDADEIEIWVDQLNTPLVTQKPYDGGVFVYERTFTTSGSRVAQVRGFREGKLIARRHYPFSLSP